MNSKINLETINMISFEDDDVKSSCGNENFYSYTNYLYLAKEKNSHVSVSETENYSELLYNCLYSYYYKNFDSNVLSKNLELAFKNTFLQN
jgi:hypothetical protein